MEPCAVRDISSRMKIAVPSDLTQPAPVLQHTDCIQHVISVRKINMRSLSVQQCQQANAVLEPVI